MCFFPKEVCKRILAKAGTTSLDRLTLTSTTPLTLTCKRLTQKDE